MESRTRLDWACWVAAKGINVFIIEPGSKRPLGGHSWYLRQTTEPETLAAWFEQTPECNYGVHLGEDYVVIDLDAGPGKQGVQEFERLCAENDIGNFLTEIDTLMVRTPGGGYHLYFRSPFPCANKNDFPDNIDVRGVIGYVVGPGSEDTRGEWAIIDPDADIIDLPEWLESYLHKPGQKDPNAHIPLIDLDLAINVQHAIEWLKERDPAFGGTNNGNDWTYETVQFLRDFGLSEEKTLEVLNVEWNQRCNPPWGDDDLEGCIKNAYRYGENRPGVKSPTYRIERVNLAHGRGAVTQLTPEQIAEMFHPKPTLAVDNTARLALEEEQGIPSEVYPVPSAVSAPTEQPVYRWMTAAELYAGHFEPLEFLLGSSFFQVGEVTPIDALPDTGKSLLMLHLAAAVASGRELWGMPVHQGPVVLVSYEDSPQVVQTRWRTILAELGVSAEEATTLPVYPLWLDKSDPDCRVAVVEKDGTVARMGPANTAGHFLPEGNIGGEN